MLTKSMCVKARRFDCERIFFLKFLAGPPHSTEVVISISMDELDALCCAIRAADGEPTGTSEATPGPPSDRSPLACANSPQRARRQLKTTEPTAPCYLSNGVEAEKRVEHASIAFPPRPLSVLKRSSDSNENGLGALVTRKQREDRAAAKASSGHGKHGSGTLKTKSMPRRVFQDAGQATTVFRSSGGLRIKNPVVSSSQLTSIMESSACIRIDQIRQRIIQDTVPKRWCMIAVVGEVSPPRTSETGSQYGIWKLTDLNESVMCLYVFGSAYQDYCEEIKPGALVCVVGGKTRRTGDSVTLSIDAFTQLTVLGESRDFGYCKGRTKNGDLCRIPVNATRCEYCSYHVGKAYKEMSSLRKELQGGSLKTAFAANKSKLKWSVGKFQAPGIGAGRGTGMVGRERLQSSAARLGGNTSTMGSKYLVTCANPTKALNAVREAESKKRQLNMAKGTGFFERAPIPTKHLASVVMGEQSSNANVRKRRQAAVSGGVGAAMSRGRSAPPGNRVGTNDVALSTSKTLIPNDPSSMVDLEADIGTSFAASIASSLPARAQAAAILRQKRANGEAVDQAPSAPAFLAKSLEAHAKKKKILESIPNARRKDLIQAEELSKNAGRLRQSVTTTSSAIPSNAPATTGQNGRNVPIHEPGSFGALFGEVIREMEATHGSEGKIESRYRSAVEGEDHANLMSRLDVLEKKDNLVQKMESTTSLNVSAFRCDACSSLTERKHSRCLKEHPQAISKVETFKRWWSCSDCKKRFSTLGVKYPRGCCVKCGSTVATFDRESMVDSRLDSAQRFADALGSQAIASREGIQARGTEHGKFMYR